MPPSITKATVFRYKGVDYPTLAKAKEAEAKDAVAFRLRKVTDAFSDAHVAKFTPKELAACDAMLAWLDKRGMLLASPKPKKKKAPADAGLQAPSQT